MKIDPLIIVTEDGSHTLYSSMAREHYHSVHGAIQESKHVFIDAGLRKVSESSKVVKILEIGFGTGLNCLLTYAEAVKAGLEVDYTSFEPFPLEESVFTELNYCKTGDLSAFKREFLLMHSQNESEIYLVPQFHLIRISSKFENAIPDQEHYNLVFFDAFSPEAQPELWLPEIFAKIRKGMVAGGILVTYSAKGEVRRSLQKSGFSTERLVGPPGKREMLRATAI